MFLMAACAPSGRSGVDPLIVLSNSFFSFNSKDTINELQKTANDSQVSADYRAIALTRLGELKPFSLSDAKRHYRTAVSLSPSLCAAAMMLSLESLSVSDSDEAVKHFA